MEFLNEDELLLLIAKNNEEALGLLFLIYEKKMRFEAQKIKNNHCFYFDTEDYIQDFKIHFLRTIANYDYTKGKLYSYWLSSIHFFSLKYFSEDTSNLVMFDSEKELEYVSFNNEVNKDLAYKELNTSLEHLKNDDQMIYQILIAWAQGFSYEEISSKMNLNKTTINYYVKKGLDFLKSKMH